MLVAAGLAGWFLWRSGGDDFGRRQQADNPVQPNGGPQKRVKVPTEPIVARLKKVAAIQANDAGVTMELEDLLFLVQAVGGAEEAAFEAIKTPPRNSKRSWASLCSKVNCGPGTRTRRRARRRGCRRAER